MLIIIGWEFRWNKINEENIIIKRGRNKRTERKIRINAVRLEFNKWIVAILSKKLQIRSRVRFVIISTGNSIKIW
jgi:hypothetical protein